MFLALYYYIMNAIMIRNYTIHYIEQIARKILLEKENTRDKIFRIASNLFKEKGYNNVTVDDICANCNISKRTFYYHLKSKSDILFHYYDHVIDNITPLLIQMLNTSNNWDQLILIFDNLIDKMMDLGPDINSQLLSINLQDNQNTFDLRQNLTDIAIHIIENAQHDKQIRNLNNASDLYRSAAYMFTGYEYMWCVKDGDFPWKEQFYNSLENLFDIDPVLRKYSNINKQ